MARVPVTLEVGSDGVAVITFSNPPVNVLARPVIDGLKEKYAEAMKRSDVKAIVLTGGGGRFSGGFDIGIFEEIQSTGDYSVLPEVSVSLVVNVIEDGRKPSVAAIQGLALGGGLELTMGCHARVSTPEAQLGLPELSLGIIPGFGGTQRLPRLVGLPKALEMLLLSKSISAKQGKEYGLIDSIASADELIRVSRVLALEIAERRKPWISSLHRTDKLGSLPEAHEILKSERQRVKKTAPHMPQHQKLLDVVEEGIIFGGYAGVLKEAKVFQELILSSTSRSLVHVFFSQRLTSKVPNVTDVALKPRLVRKAAVIGGGLMGSGIATALILSGTHVILKEINAVFMQKGLDSVAANLEGLVKKGTLTKDKMIKTLLLLKGVLDYSEFKDVDMVIEAAVEKIPLKQSIFVDLERICPPHCVLATNTSTIDLNVVGEKTSSQDRIVGAHFFSPAHVMPLLEIIRTEKTSPQVILDVMTVGKAIKKVPIVVGNCTGFAVNRTFFPYTQGAQLLVHFGVDLFRIDRVITNFGMPMGPFQLADVSGYGVAMAVKPIFASAFSDRVFICDLMELMVKSGRQGKANGRGFYLYEKGSKPKPDPSVLAVIEESRKLVKIHAGKNISVTDEDILEMVFFPVINEACRAMDEGVVIRASDLDIASVLGMGFPRFRGGLVFWADTIGAGYIYSKLNKWAETFGGFFRPSPYLEERAKKNLPLSMINLSPSQSSRARL